MKTLLFCPGSKTTACLAAGREVNSDVLRSKTDGTGGKPGVLSWAKSV